VHRYWMTISSRVLTPDRRRFDDSQRLVTRRPTDNLKTLWEGSGYLASDLNDFELSADPLASLRAGSLPQNSKSKAKAKSKDRSLRQLLQLDRVRLKNRSAARPPSRAGSLLQNSKSRIKRSQPSAAPTVGSRKTQNQVGCQAAFASRLAPAESKSSAAARGEAAPLNNERKLE